MNNAELELVFPTKEYKKDVEEYLQEFLDNGEDEIAGDGGLDRIIGKEKGMPYEDDLYLDVVVTPKGDIKLLDEDELKDAFDRFEVNKSDYEMAYNEAKKLMNRLQNNKYTLKEFTDKYLKEMLVEGENADL